MERRIFWGEIKYFITVIAIVLFAYNLTELLLGLPHKASPQRRKYQLFNVKWEVKNIRSRSKGTESSMSSWRYESDYMKDENKVK